MIRPASVEQIREAAAQLARGELVAFPTETVYGLGANALDASAVRKIFEVKGRPATDPLIVHLAQFSELEKVADLSRLEAPERLQALAAIWPGPLTLVLPAREELPLELRAGLPSVAVRIPNHPVAQALLRECTFPIAAPSANPFSYVSPTCAEHVEAQLGAKIDLILDGGECAVGLESTILSLLESPALLLRPGAISVEQIESLIGPIKVSSKIVSASQAAPAPGMLKKHYSPRTPVYFKTEVSADSFGHSALISFSELSSSERDRFAKVIELSQKGDLNEIAHNLFKALRELDHGGVSQIIVDQCSEHGLGLAIMDRLRKAHA